MPLSVGSWFIGLFAVYYQKIAVYTVVFGLNIAIGVAIFVFHSLGDKQVNNNYTIIITITDC